MPLATSAEGKNMTNVGVDWIDLALFIYKYL